MFSTKEDIEKMGFCLAEKEDGMFMDDLLEDYVKPFVAGLSNGNYNSPNAFIRAEEINPEADGIQTVIGKIPIQDVVDRLCEIIKYTRYE